jgi:hypothetical protein
MKSKISFFLLIVSSFIFGQNESEPNNTFGDANLIQIGTGENASINPQNDADIFKVQITQPGVLSVNVSDVPSNIAIKYEFYGTDQLLFEPTTYNSNGKSLTRVHQISTPGIYYIKLRDAGANSAQYNLLATFDISDIHEPNDVLSTSTLIDCNIPIFASINPLNDNDCFKFTLAKADIVTANITQVPSNLSINAKLYGPLPSTYNSIKNITGNTGQSFLISEQLQPGEYIICLTGNKANEAKYKLELICPSIVNIEDVLLDKSILIYPNPINDHFTIELKERSSNQITYLLINYMGQIIKTGIIENKHVSINTTNLLKGAYFLEIISENRIFTRKIVKE